MIKELRTQRLILRPLKIEDAESRLKIMKNVELTNLIGSDTVDNLDYIKRVTETQIHTNNLGISCHWSILLKECSTFIGNIHLYAPAPSIYSWKERLIGFVLLKEFWRNGYMSEAIREVIQFSKENSIERLQAYIAHYNESSLSFLHNHGFKTEGIQRKKGFWNNQRHDMYVYALLLNDALFNEIPLVSHLNIPAVDFRKS